MHVIVHPVLLEELSAVVVRANLIMLPVILLGLILGAEALSVEVEQTLKDGGKNFQELKQGKLLRAIDDRTYLLHYKTQINHCH